MLKRILVPLDGSALAETALPYAKQIIDKPGKISLLTIIDPISYGDPSFYRHMILTDHQDLRKYTEEYLKGIAAQFVGSKLKVETIVSQGDPADEIVYVVQSASIDAIVMSTHGRTGLLRWILGSVTQKVIGAAQCPIFVVPSRQEI